MNDSRKRSNGWSRSATNCGSGSTWERPRRRTEWNKLDGRITELRARLDRAGDEAGDVMEDVGEAAKLLGDEIRTGFERLRRML